VGATDRFAGRCVSAVGRRAVKIPDNPLYLVIVVSVLSQTQQQRCAANTSFNGVEVCVDKRLAHRCFMHAVRIARDGVFSGNGTGSS